MTSSPELKTLLKCHEQLVVLVRNNLEEISRNLHVKDIIGREKYREVTDTKSILSDDEKAKRILHWLGDKVEEDTKYFTIFVEYLSSVENCSKMAAELRKMFTLEVEMLNQKESKLLKFS